MTTLLVGLAIVALMAGVSGLMLFGVKPQPVTDPRSPLGIPTGPVRDALGLFKRNQPGGVGIVERIKTAGLFLFAMLAVGAVVVAVAAGVAFALARLVATLTGG